MTDIELTALVALVNQETVIIDSCNKDRLRDGYALAYQDFTNHYIELENELKKRGAIC